MPIERRVQLQSRLERWNRYTAEAQSEIRENAEATWTQPDHESLLKSMRAYSIWKTSIPSDLLDQIESNDLVQRRKAIATAIEQSKNEMVKASGSQLDDETIERLYFALTQLVEDRFKTDFAGMRRFKEMSKRMAPEIAKWTAIRFSFSSDYPIRDRIFRPRGANPPQQKKDQMPPRSWGRLTDKEMSTLRLVLSNDSLDRLSLLSGGDRMLEEMALRIWVDEAIRRKSPLADDQTLIERYSDLEPNDREVIDLLPPKDMLRELSKEGSAEHSR